MRIRLEDDGSLSFLDGNGDPLAENLQQIARKQQGDSIRAWLEEEAQAINKDIEAVLNIHREAPTAALAFDTLFPVQPFEEPAPVKPALKRIGWLTRTFRRAKASDIRKENQNALLQFGRDLREWEAKRDRFEMGGRRRRQEVRDRFESDPDFMSEVLETRFREIRWPRETLVSLEVPSKDTLFLDVDLPEIKDMPSVRASVPARGLKLSKTSLSEKAQREQYMLHIHAVAFRLLGEVFATLPGIRTAYVSGFSQRIDRATGRVADEYLYSVRVSRGQWDRIDFTHLAAIDPVEALGALEIRRRMTKTGVFSAVEPFAPPY